MQTPAGQCSQSTQTGLNCLKMMVRSCLMSNQLVINSELKNRIKMAEHTGCPKKLASFILIDRIPFATEKITMIILRILMMLQNSEIYRKQ